jgi:hypothetical protein
MFGVSPERFERERAAAADAQALAFARLSPIEKASFGVQRGAYGLAGALGGALGGQDPELQRVTMRQQLLGTIDPSRPETFDLAAQAAEQAGDTQLAFGLRLEAPKYRQQAQTAQAAQQAAVSEQRAADLIGQLKNADGTVNQTVLSELQTFPQGMAAISAQAKIIPDLRRLGAAGSQEIDPFAVLINDEAIPQNVQTLAKQYSKSYASGTLGPEKVDVMFKELVAMAERANQFAERQAQLKAQQEQLNLFRAQGLENSRAAQQLAQSNKALQEQNEQAERERKAEAERNKPLPSFLAKQEDEDFTRAQATSNLAMDVNNYITRIKQGEIPFGLKETASIRARQAFGSSAPDVLAREDYDRFVLRLVNESLRLNKGPQTDFDFKQAEKELKTSQSPEAAAAVMKRLLDVNLRTTENLANQVLTRRSNAGFAPPRMPIDVPVIDVQIMNNKDYNSFLKNPKYPSGTPFIDPKGVRRTKP